MEQKLNRYDYYVIALLISTIFGGLGGAFQISRLLAIVLIIPAINAYKRGRDLLLDNVVLCFVLMMVYATLSLLWTPNSINALKELVYFPIHMFFFIELVVFTRLSKKKESNLINGYTIAFLLTAIFALYEIISGNHLSISVQDSDSTNYIGYGERVEAVFASVTFGNYNAYVTYIAFLFPFLLQFAFKKTTFLKAIIQWFPVFLALFILSTNASRGGILAAAIAIFVFFYNAKASYRVILLIFSLIAGAFALLYLNQFLIYAYYRLFENDVFNDSSRIAIWLSALRALSDYCYIGCGIGGISAALESARAPISACHNLVVEIALQWGVLFLVMFLLFLFRMFILARKNSNTNKVIVYSILFSMPFALIINSGYIVAVPTWAYMASLFILSTQDRFNRRLLVRNKIHVLKNQI